MSNVDEKRPILEDVYSLIAELWCCPPEAETERREIKEHAEKIVRQWERVDTESAMSLIRFLGENAISEEDYIDLFELDPRCPLYLGSHTYEEPKTCANAAVSDRNEYMIDLVGIYKHFGRQPNGKELPDYLPLIVNFLSLTAGSRDDPVRGKLINEYLLPYLPPIRARLKELETPYLYLLDALEKAITTDQIKQTT